ncbi:MAG: Holliday junction branch migration protein RuvA [Gammaproteobacteria bacterium]|nr:Holliday junction branch migration protein RuvA [Gammaproteobacteria bacterium]RPG25476.1 MAG: Holliday junction branch migration protein RuvA [Gammaproteobacteria bacterium TMED50]|tara:strand:- start:8473 stop:9057 length:585 start_codon:yes stop_codon:yes gene_type:complete
MIGRLTGRVIEREPSQLVVDVAGVGYEVEIPMPVYDAVLEGEAVTLFTHLAVVRDGPQALYGFTSRADRDLFRLLIRVNNVGPKLAVGVLSAITPDELSISVAEDDTSRITRISGVGKKTAERLLMELRDKLPKVSPLEARVELQQLSDHQADAEAALIGLGFKPQEVSRALAQIDNPDDEVEAVIRQCLKLLG